ncbi:hypothetical protein [Aquabacterium sp. OR-4]|uniref:hypothetical protein n=1 Tax=Aquabacterium sp. OR-4 TaxID=2978127 RepID=UPI0021B4335D|nr:hypothetical protein [Aquabacterium sp. OR-4]MDT7836810.1 hypothetical protein [Aquabacterium sp. OR-4]
MFRRRLFGFATLALLRPDAWALPSPTGPVLLTVSGRLRQAGAAASFDMAMLERLPQAHIHTHTPWYAQARRFSGPLLREVIAAAGGQLLPGGTLRARALNDYAVEIPANDALRYDIVLARLMDDKPMPVRDKGPLFIVYPFDGHRELRNAVYYSRCAWQLKSIEVL